MLFSTHSKNHNVYIEYFQTFLVKGELEKLLAAEGDHGPHLSYEEITTVRRNLATQGVEVDNEAIR